MNIFVGNLNFQTTEEQLNDLFSSHGEVISVKIIIDKFTGRSRGFGFVEFSNSEDGLQAIEHLNAHDFNGRPLVVNESKPQEKKDRFDSKRY